MRSLWPGAVFVWVGCQAPPGPPGAGGSDRQDDGVAGDTGEPTAAWPLGLWGEGPGSVDPPWGEEVEDEVEHIPRPVVEGPCAEAPADLNLDGEDGAFLYSAAGDTPHILDLCLELDPEAWAALDLEPREDVRARLVFAGVRWDVGLHLKGSAEGSFRTMDDKASFKVDVQEFGGDRLFHGVRRLTLNNMIQDPTMAAEHAAYRMFRAMGVPAPRHGYARVWVNDELFGLYGVVETLDEQFMDRTFDDGGQGTLYEGGYGADLYDWAPERFEVKEGDDQDRADLEALIEAVEAMPADGVLDLIDTWFHRDALLSMWAVELLISDDDGYTTLANNFMLAHPEPDGRWWMVPWGPDQSFHPDADGDVGIYDPLHGRLAVACRADPACSAALDADIELALRVWAALDIVDFVDRTTLAIEEDCRADPRSDWGDYGCRDQQAAMRAWVRERPGVVQAALDAGG